MPSRYLRDSILTSEQVDMLSYAAEVFYRRLMSVVDDFGRYDAREAVLRRALYVLRDDSVRLQDISEWMQECVSADLITRYESDGKPYLVMHKLGEPRAKNSKFPAPPAGIKPESVIPFSDKEKATRAQVVVNTQSVYKRIQTQTDAERLNADVGACNGVNASVPITSTSTNTNTSTPERVPGDGMDAVITVDQLPPPDDSDNKAKLWLASKCPKHLRHFSDLGTLIRLTGSLERALMAVDVYLDDPKIRNPFSYILPKLLEQQATSQPTRRPPPAVLHQTKLRDI